jgi:hypothetical protein
MRKKHMDILNKFGAELIDIETREGRGDALAYIVKKDGKEYRWGCSSVDREAPPWEYKKKVQKRYVYGNAPYIYRMFNSCGDLLYIGKTSQLDYRLYAHFYKHIEEWKDQVAVIDAHRFDKESDMHVYEMYLITKYKPAFNRDASCIDEPSFNLPEIAFEEIAGWE